jgi:hypothetical protein
MSAVLWGLSLQVIRHRETSPKTLYYVSDLDTDRSQWSTDIEDAQPLSGPRCMRIIDWMTERRQWLVQMLADRGFVLLDIAPARLPIGGAS